MTDTIADMLTRIRNGQKSKHSCVTMQTSRLKVDVVKVLCEEGFLKDYVEEEDQNNRKILRVFLKYYQDKPVIEKIKRISRPGLRIYKKASELHNIPGFGAAILSTSKGVMTHHAAKKLNIGGEVICEVA